MRLKGFKKSDGSLAKIYTDPTLTESDSPADAASVKAKDDQLEQKINANTALAEALDGRVDELEAGAPSIIAPKVTEWLEDNVNPVGSAVTVDSSLTVAGSAADAKKTGDEIDAIKTGYLKIGPSVLTDAQKEQTRASIGAATADEVFSTAAKNALIELLKKVAYIDTSGQDYIDELSEALGVDGSTPSVDTDGDLGFLSLSNVISGKYIGTDGSIVTSTNETTRYCEDYYQINPLAQTFISINGTSQAFGIAEYDEQYNFIKNSTFTDAPWIARQYIFDSSTKYIRFWWSFTSIPTPEISVAVKGTPLSFEIGDVNATTGADATSNYRIRTGSVSVNDELITVIGCPFAKSWDDWGQYSGYAMRCFQDPSTYIGNVGDTSTGDSSRPFFDADITDKSLLTGTDYVRFVMVYDNRSSIAIATHVGVKANITINGVKYWLVLSS